MAEVSLFGQRLSPIDVPGPGGMCREWLEVRRSEPAQFPQASPDEGYAALLRWSGRPGSVRCKSAEARCRAALGSSEEDRRQPATTNNDQEGTAVCRALLVCLPSYTQVSSHIRDRQSSIGIA